MDQRHLYQGRLARLRRRISLRELRRCCVAVRPGDRITYLSRIESLTETKRPEWGLVTSRMSGVNQNGAEVFSGLGGVLWERLKA